MFDASTLLALWPAWEVEELNCIHNYLSRRLSDVIDEVAEHDVKMGESYGNVAFDRMLHFPSVIGFWLELSRY